jgi:hypothetical protein
MYELLVLGIAIVVLSLPNDVLARLLDRWTAR